MNEKTITIRHSFGKIRSDEISTFCICDEKMITLKFVLGVVGNLDNTYVLRMSCPTTETFRYDSS